MFYEVHRFQFKVDGPLYSIAVSGDGRCWVNGNPALPSHPAVTALRAHAAIPEWVRSALAMPDELRGIAAQVEVPVDFTWTAPAWEWQPPRDWGSAPLASCRPARIGEVAIYPDSCIVDEVIHYPSLH